MGVGEGEPEEELEELELLLEELEDEELLELLEDDEDELEEELLEDDELPETETTALALWVEPAELETMT